MAKKVIKTILFLLLLLVIAAAGFFAYITMSEYKPDDQETLDIISSSQPGASDIKTPVYAGQDVRIATWNIGYGALGEDADFFMDGGESVKTADEAGVKENIDSIKAGLADIDADIMFLQEVDRDSARSSDLDEADMLLAQYGLGSLAVDSSAGSSSDAASSQDQQSGEQDPGQAAPPAAYPAAADPGTKASFALNFKTPFVPYPMPPIGKVESGLLTISSFNITSAERHSLPCPFKWPVRAVNLKRCLMIDRVPVIWTKDGSDKHELVLINLHLEAYDNGEGKSAQTKVLKQIMDEEYNKGNYVVVGGDFNQTFSTVDIDAYPTYEGMWLPGKIDTDDFSDEWQFLMDDKAPTCRSLDKAYAGADKDSFQYYMIDGFIVSDNIKVKSISTKQLDFKNSDHNPVVIDIKLK